MYSMPGERRPRRRPRRGLAEVAQHLVRYPSSRVLRYFSGQISADLPNLLVGGDAAEWWDEGAAPTPAKAVAAIKKHHVYTAGATAGSMATVWMNLEFADGTSTGRGSVEPSEPYLADAGFREALRRYVATGKGSKMAKYVPAGYLDA